METFAGILVLAVVAVLAYFATRKKKSSTVSSEETRADFLTVNLPDVLILPNIPRQVVAKLPNKHYDQHQLFFTFRSNGYFEKNTTDAHIALVMRNDSTKIGEYVNGTGMVFGDVSRAPNPGGNPLLTPNPVKPSVQFETWFNNIPQNGRANYLLAAGMPPILRDGIDYDIYLITYSPTNRAQQFLRMIVIETGSVIYDTGEVNDPNLWYDQEANDVVTGHVFDNADSGWSVEYKNVRIELSN